MFFAISRVSNLQNESCVFNKPYNASFNEWQMHIYVNYVKKGGNRLDTNDNNENSLKDNKMPEGETV